MITHCGESDNGKKSPLLTERGLFYLNTEAVS